LETANLQSAAKTALLLAIALGLVVAIAWIAAARTSEYRVQRLLRFNTNHLESYWTVLTSPGAQTTCFVGRTWTEATSAVQGTVFIEDHAPPNVFERMMGSPASRCRVNMLLDAAFGYPFPALHWCSDENSPNKPRGGLSIGSPPFGFLIQLDIPNYRSTYSWQNYSRTVLPYAPLWGGLILDTVLYAGTIAWLVWIWRQTRRAFRKRRRRCAECGYSLAGLNGARCPECGV
jgi:hypothetical protein